METILTAGFNQPTGPFPSASRASLMADTMAAKIGADADVPPLVEKLSLTATTVGYPFAATSG